MKIGVDGGGTKTELILIGPDGEVGARHTAPGCNPSVIGPENACKILTDALSYLRLAHPAPITHTLLCMAGSPACWQEFAATLSDFGKIETSTDALPVLELATSGKTGLVLHAGTGSFVALRAPDETLHYAGGFGWRVGDPGSAQDVGRRALARALAELQGWAPASGLGTVLREMFATDKPGTITAALHRDPEPNQRIGAFAARTSQLAVSGDTVARDIVLASTGELLACAETAARTIFKTQPLAALSAGLSGPILTQPFVVAALQARTFLPLKPLTEPPIEGVRQLLRKR